MKDPDPNVFKRIHDVPAAEPFVTKTTKRYNVYRPTGLPPQTYPRKWERVDLNLFRLRVFGGWLVHELDEGLVFVPDIGGLWTLEGDEKAPTSTPGRRTYTKDEIIGAIAQAAGNPIDGKVSISSFIEVLMS